MFKATATIAKNCRASNAFTDNSHDFDVWIEATAQTRDGFCIIGACLTDIWNLCGDNDAEIAKNHMYVRLFSEAK